MTAIAHLALLAAVALPAEASAARLTRCAVQLDLPVGAVQVPGFGHDEEEARARARAVAAALAGHHAHAQLFGGLIAEPGTALGRHVTQLTSRDLGAPAPAPGYRVADADCERFRLPANPAGAAWEATWATDMDGPAIRNDAAVAVEAARRRTCFGSYQAAVHGTLARAEGSDWHLVTALGDAADALVRCATEASPTLRPAHAPLPAVDEDDGTVFACHRPRRIGGQWAATPGYGASLEAAREAALARDLLLVSRRIGADALGALSAPEDPRAAIRRAVEPLSTLVVSTDVVEQATLVCSAQAPATLGFAWVPAEGCGEREAPIGVVASASALEGLVGARCDEVLTAGTRNTLSALSGGRRDDGALAARGLSTALTCAASCSRDLAVDGWTATPVFRPGELDRSTPQAAARELARAVERRDLEAFGVLTGGLMFDPAYSGAARRDPDGFWGSLAEAGRTGRLAEAATWEQVAGQWLLTFE